MAAIEVCKYMGGWDWHTFQSQPAWFIDLIRGKMHAEATVDNANARQNAKKAK